ncbi:hypothetical protein NDU88_001986 [Pleurodeles waltl]|uniref:Uncharacterized protein n=1 Tax=Pleurodeles waltl TaxID=8319 RepID=A0AAV7WP11_PLEWA|nr:hypothetical protein NDU88_001986 [Pleurodeles waltl]
MASHRNTPQGGPGKTQGETQTALTRKDCSITRASFRGAPPAGSAGCLALLSQSLPGRFRRQLRHDRENTARLRNAGSLEPPSECPHQLVPLAAPSCSARALPVRGGQAPPSSSGRYRSSKKTTMKTSATVFLWAAHPLSEYAQEYTGRALPFSFFAGG